MTVFTYAYLTNALDDYVADDIPVSSGFPLVKLVKEPFTPSPTMGVSDIVVADFPGYADKQLKFSGFAKLDSAGQAIITADVQIAWTSVGIALNQQIYGFVLIDQNADVIAVGTFASPQPMDAPGKVVQLAFTVGLRAPLLDFELLP